MHLSGSPIPIRELIMWKKIHLFSVGALEKEFLPCTLVLMGSSMEMSGVDIPLLPSPLPFPFRTSST